MLNESDHRAIAAAIDAVEQKTSGDIYCIVSQEASNYREVPLAWAAIVALLLPPLVLLAGASPRFLAHPLSDWQIAEVSSRAHELVFALSMYALIQAILFAATALIVSIPAVRRLVTPHFLKRHRTLQLAQQHFVSAGMHLATGQPHVLIFLALHDRRVEVLADAAVHKVAGEQPWKDASAAVIQGMKSADPTTGIVRAIEIAGAPLVEHFPAKGRAHTESGFAEV
jgi:putative membrane protein